MLQWFRDGFALIGFVCVCWCMRMLVLDLRDQWRIKRAIQRAMLRTNGIDRIPNEEQESRIEP